MSLYRPDLDLVAHDRRDNVAAYTGIDLLAEAGAACIKICYELDNPPAKDLYLSVGFEPARQTVVFARRGPPRQDPGEVK